MEPSHVAGVQGCQQDMARRNEKTQKEEKMREKKRKSEEMNKLGRIGEMTGPKCKSEKMKKRRQRESYQPTLCKNNSQN